MEKEAKNTEKPRFCEVCQMHNLDYQAMESIAKKAGLPKYVLDTMAVSVVVKRGYAEKALAALSELTGEAWTLDTVKVALLPTFADFHKLHQFDLYALSATSSVSFDVISMMLDGKAVPMGAASLVLKAASVQTGQKYTLDNVDVKLSEREKGRDL